MRAAWTVMACVFAVACASSHRDGAAGDGAAISGGAGGASGTAGAGEAGVGAVVGWTSGSTGGIGGVSGSAGTDQAGVGGSVDPEIPYPECQPDYDRYLELKDRAHDVACTKHEDCALVGTCEGDYGQLSIPQSLVSETEAFFASAVPCASLRNEWAMSSVARCEAGSCVKRESGVFCPGHGQADWACTEGAFTFRAPCTSAAPDNAWLERGGCYVPCDVAAADACADGSTCRSANVCAVDTGYEAEGCWQCDAISVAVCVMEE